MDNLREVGKTIRKSHKETDQNVRRQKENFPDVHRNVDSVSPTSGYRIEFPTTNHPHNVRMNLHVREMIKPCEITPPDIYVACTAHCGTFPNPAGSLGIYHPENGDIVSNIGGFIVNPAGGLIVPVTGYYNITFSNFVAGVSISESSFIYADIRVNGGIVAGPEIKSPGHGYGHGLSGTFVSMDVYATGVFMSAGDTVGGYLAASDIAFYTPSDLCFLPGDSPFQVVLVGVP